MSGKTIMILIMLVGTFIEMFALYRIFFSVFEPRYNRKTASIIFIAVISLNNIRTLFMIGQVLEKLITSMVMLQTLAFLLLKGKWYKKIIIHMLYMVCVMSAELISVFLAATVFNCNINDIETPDVRIYMWQLTSYILIFLFCSIMVTLLKNKKVDIESKPQQYLYIYGSVQCMLICIFVALTIQYGVPFGMMMLLLVFVFVHTVFMGVLIYKAVKKSVLKELEISYAKKEAEMMDAHFAELRRHYDDYRRLRHDFLNHINIIDTLKDSKKIKSYTNEIKKQFDKMDESQF